MEEALDLSYDRLLMMIQIAGKDSSVGIATRYGLDDQEIESRPGGEIFRIRPYRPWGPPSLLYSGYRVSFPGLMRPGRGVNHPPQSSAEVKEKNYTSLSLWAFMACSRANFTFSIHIQFVPHTEHGTP